MQVMHFMREIRDMQRFEKILTVFAKHGLGYFIEEANLKRYLPLKERLSPVKFKLQKTRPVVLRTIFEELGGTFIKLGQLLSLRPDLIPKEYCDEFSKLQDQVKPFPSSEAKKIIEQELGKPIHLLFSSFDDKPLAAASIGQVHRATLRDGTKVVVKVQRPHIQEIMQTDIDILYRLASLFEKKFPQDFIQPTKIIQEFEAYTKNELDYNHEAKNAEKFYAFFQGDRKITIPKPYLNLTTTRVLVLEYLDGKNITHADLSPEQKKEISVVIADMIFRQIFEEGFFHADPHPGNIFVLRKRRIGLLDYGIVGMLDSPTKETLSQLFIAMMEKNVEGMADALLGLGAVPPDVDRQRFIEDLKHEFGSYYGAELHQIDLAQVLTKVVGIAKRHAIVLPINLILLCKAIITLQGLGMELNPHFNLVAVGKPYLNQLVKKQYDPREKWAKLKKAAQEIRYFVASVPRQASEFISKIRETDKDLKQMDTDIKILTIELDKSSNRIALVVLSAAFIIAGAYLYPFDQQQLFGFPFLSVIFFTVALLFFLLLCISIVREKRFTF
ncbi:AarF/ABC1/UbiB kinase family protein [Candidatus Woesearchaeota archaeon]|nr:AarF/ABC1/UbiB kinase family protein [Candidatus Woesearchaeota archaeon]